MSQPQDFEMGSRSSSTYSRTDRSKSVSPTEKVHVQVGDQAIEELADVEQTLKRGLEARQVSVRLAHYVK
jgi:hypothetical protein